MHLIICITNYHVVSKLKAFNQVFKSHVDRNLVRRIMSDYSVNLQRVHRPEIMNAFDPEVEMDIERVSRSSRADNEADDNQMMSVNDTFSLCKTYFDKKFEHLKRQITVPSPPPSKTRKLNTELKFKANQKQLAFNNEIDEIIDEAIP